MNVIQQSKIQHRYHQPKKTNENALFLLICFFWALKENEQVDEGKSNPLFIFINLLKYN